MCGIEITPREADSFARDVYTYGPHLLIAGVIVIATALEGITLHPNVALPIEFRWMLFVGLVMYFGGVVITIWRAFHAVAKERLITLVVLTIPTGFAGSMSGLTLLLTDALLSGVLVAERARIEGWANRDSVDELRPGSSTNAT